MSAFEYNYKNLLFDCLNNGELTDNRTGVKTLKLFNKTLIIDLTEGFPIVTGKKVFFEKALAEFNWMYEGKTDLRYLHKHNVKWWDDFAIDNQLGKVYGYQIKKYNGYFNQIKYAINQIKNNSRRAIINLWNPCDLQEQSLPCCFTQFNFVRVNNDLNMTMTFRSSDLFLGLPYDIIVGALFLITIAKECGLNFKLLGINISDAHIYQNHIEQVNKYCFNKTHSLPFLSGEYGSYLLNNYISEKYIKAELVK